MCGICLEEIPDGSIACPDCCGPTLCRECLRGGGDRGDLMSGSPAGLYSSEEGKEHDSVWHSSESDIDTGRFKRRASDHLEFSDNAEGTLNILKVHMLR